MYASAQIRRWTFVLPALLLTAASPTKADPPNSSYRLIFADEFNGTSINTAKWNVASPGWLAPNSDSAESASEVSVGNGVLALSSIRPSTTGTFNSGAVSTYQNFNPTGGYYESRIQLPTTPGSWPAFWGLETGWPPEADIMEYPLTAVSGDGFPNTAYNTDFHYVLSGTDESAPGEVNTSENLSTTGYHMFGMSWVSGASMTFYLDNSAVSSITNSVVSQMTYMYLILDYAVGGWPGTPTTTQWPVGHTDQMDVDWVRVWQINPNGDTTSNWNISGNGSFATSGNWSNGIEPAFGNQTAYFGRVNASTASITMPSWVVFGNITFDGSGGNSTAYTIGTSSSQLVQLASTVGSVVQATAASTVNQNINADVELWSNTTFENSMTGGQAINLNSPLQGSGTMSVTGPGPVVLNAANSINTGGASIGLNQEAAFLQLAANNALGSGGLVIGPGGNATTASLQLTGTCLQANSIDFRGRTNSSVGIESLSGNNVLAGAISADVGGNTFEIQSDAGLLTLSGTVNADSGTRAFTLQGAGNGVVSGAIQNGAGTVSIVKSGTDLWTLSGPNTYTGGTTISSGTLQVTPMPVADYSFDKVSGSTVVNSGAGGSAMNGTLAGGAAIVSGGRFGNAVSLSGGAYVNINNPIMDMGSAANWTVSAWVKTTTAGSTLLTKGSGTSWTTGNTIFYLGDGSGGGSGGLPSSVRYAGGFFQASTSGTPVTDGTWHMVTYVNNSGTCAIYVDGVSQALSSGNSGFGNADAGSVVRIGITTDTASGDGTVNFNGLMDEVQFYGQALSQAQITSLYSGATPAGSLSASGGITVASGGTLLFGVGNILGNGSSTTVPSGGLIVNQGGSLITSASPPETPGAGGGDANIFGNITLNGATWSVGSGYSAAYQAAILLGSVTAAGSAPSYINTTSTNMIANGLMLGGVNGGTVTFDVSAGGLTISAPLVNAANGATGGLIKTDVGVLTLTGDNTYNGATTVNGGQLIVSGTIGTTSTIAVGGTGVGAAFYQSGVGTLVNNTSSALGDFQIGAAAGALGYYNLSGGAIDVSNLNTSTGGEIDIGGASGGAGTFAQFDMSGGNIVLPNNAGTYFLINRGGAGETGIVNFLGGTVAIAGGGTPTDNNIDGIAANWTTNQTATITLSGTAQVLTPSLWVKLNVGTGYNGTGTAGDTAVLNLDGGTLQALGIEYTGTNSTVNFNGGTLEAGNAANASFMTGLAAAYVYSGGGTINNNGQAITINQPLLAPTGNGVSAVAMTNAGSGYAVPPQITFSGGAGTGATAYSTINPTTGAITGIVITNPGTGYSSAPVVTLTGSTAGTAASLGTVSMAANTSGGLTFTGSGSTTLAGTSTYTGSTILNSGTLTAGASSAVGGPFGNNSSVVLANAAGVTLNITGFNTSIGSLSGGGANGGNIILGSATLTISGTGSPGPFAGVISGSGGRISKFGAGTLILSGSNTYTGATDLIAGTLGINGSLAAGGSLLTLNSTFLTGTGVINATATVDGTDSPGYPVGAQSFGTLTYANTAHLACNIGSNSVAVGTFGQVKAAGAVSIAGGAVVDIVLNGAGGAAALTNSFWTQSQSWTVLTAASLSGTFTLGSISADSTGLQVSSYGVLSLQQSSTAVTLVYTPYTVQQLWQRQYFGANWNTSTVSGDLANPANDGVSNLMKFALGMNPMLNDAVPWTPGNAGLPVQSTMTVSGTNYLSLIVRCPIGLTAITYTGLVSGDLVNWTNATQEAPTSNGDGSQTIIFLDTVPSNQATQRFIRLQVTGP